MKTRLFVLFVMMLVAASPLLAAAQAAKTATQYISDAKALADGGKLAEAIAMLQEAAVAYPQSSEVFAYLGSYIGQTAGQQGANYTEAMRLVAESYGYLDKAVALGPENPIGYFFRGIMGVNVPVFLGKLPAGIADLKQAIAHLEKTPAAVPQDMLIQAYSMLAKGYEAAENPADARAIYEKIVKFALGSDAAKHAGERLAAMAPAETKENLEFLAPKPGDPAAVASLKKSIEAEPANAALFLDLARAFMEAKRFEEARDALHVYNAKNPSNADAYRLLFQTVGILAQKGYDPKIAEDTTYRTNLAFEAMSTAEKVVELAPDNLEARLNSGIVGVSMPFFVGKFDQGVADLEHVLKNTKSPADSAQAMLYLGGARQRQAMRFWLDVATKFPDTEAARMAMDAMKPVEPNFDLAKAVKPIVTLDFVSGFRDELAPQIAIWIEDAAEKHVKTVYVSGFAGHVKGNQITLPVWAATTKFEGADAVTGASIDVGHYVYTWDCKGLDGKPVKPGTYTVKVEVSHWPSMKYQLAEATITVGKSENSARVEEGDYIPSLVVTYYPK